MAAVCSAVNSLFRNHSYDNGQGLCPRHTIQYTARWANVSYRVEPSRRLHPATRGTRAHAAKHEKEVDAAIAEGQNTVDEAWLGYVDRVGGIEREDYRAVAMASAVASDFMARCNPMSQNCCSMKAKRSSERLLRHR